MNIYTITASVSRNAGGLFTSVRRLNQSLAELDGTSISVLGLWDGFSEADARAWLPLVPETFQAQGPKLFGYSSRLSSALHAPLSAPDLLHVHGIWQYPSVATLRWHRKTGQPHVVSPRGMLDPWAVKNSHWKKRIAAWLYENAHLREAACLHALCQSEADSMRAYGFKNPIAVIPNGIDIPEIGNAETLKFGKAETPTTEGIDLEEEAETLRGSSRNMSACQHVSISDFAANGRKVLLYLGRIHPKKGLINLLRAWAAVTRPQSSDFCPPSSDWTLAIAGWDQGGHEAELKQLATELGVKWADVRDHREPNSISAFSFQDFSICFLGPQFGSEKAAAYRNCDAFILPSYSEGLPMVVLEAWAYGKPVLMTPECNLPEGFAANAALRIAPNAEGIAQGLNELVAMDDASRLALGARGRSLVASRFTWPKIAADMLGVYHWVLGQGPRPDCVQLK